MKRVVAALLLMAICCGCSREEDPYRVDTVVRIPVNPTDARADSGTPATSGTVAPTEDPAWNDGIWNGGWFATEPAATEKQQDKQNGKQDTHASREDAMPEWTMPAAPPETEPEPTRYTIAGYVPGAAEYGLLDAINAYRRDAGVPALAMDETLCAIASLRGYEQSLYWSHTRPDGRDYATVLTDYGYPGEAVAELSALLGEGYAPETAVQMWMESKTHSRMMLTEASAAGIGLFRAVDAVCICVIIVR